jgi:DNA-binding NarL/FixJ family response regulator
MPIKLLLADDHQMFLDGVKLIFSQNPDIEIIGEAQDGEELLYILRSHKPNILLLDVNMPKLDGLDVMEKIATHYKDLKVIIISTYNDYNLITKLKRLGIKGYLLKTASSEELLEAIEKVYQEGEYWHKDIEKVIEAKAEQEDKYDNFLQKFRLTTRELEVLKYVAQGKTTEEIADVMCLSTFTIETYRKTLLKKLGLKNIAGLTRFAIEHCII